MESKDIEISKEIGQCLDNNQPAWTRCEFTVNIDTSKFSMELGYEENAFREGSLR
ncbi:hypothetical protein O0882_11560 [Janthinobacterium sp. SUN073]|uniref:hypothetical protein n=1 Tax=Janthinobacterium sp. SUN073 TaxID=3004102 RepID=UPI0025AF7992|nr:hypothetical protein [Janthinobacterium sp. SUN073]MDN2696956.1 hypothetical protein [Janthinobacterium sp. SUN073]